MTAPARILFVDHTAALSGGEIALLNLVRHLDRTRFEPFVLLFADGPLVRRLAQAGIQTQIFPLSPEVAQARKDALGMASLLRLGKLFTSGAFVARLRGFMVRNEFDLVHTNSLKADLLGGLAARLARKPLIWHIHDRIETDYLPKPVVAVVRRLAALLPNAVVANSQATLTTLQLPPRRPSRVIPPGVDPARFAAVDPGQCNGGSAVHDPYRPLVAIVGRISPWKGQHVFLRAAALVRAEFPHARFRIVGSALFDEHEYERSLRALVAELGLDRNVEFTGFVEDVPAMFGQIDLLVHASTSPEPFGQVIVEAMAAAKPVVATGGGGVTDIVEDQVTGILVPMGEPGAMAQAIRSILQDPEAASRMGAHGRQRVLDRFTIQHTVEQIQALYRSLLESPCD